MRQRSYDNTPTLYLVPTPIGNLEDITLRSIKILKEVDVIFCEDTRETLNLLRHLEIKQKTISLHKYNEDVVKKRIIGYLKNGYSVALVSDRGTPLISDPGFKCVNYAIEEGYNVVGLPGPTALITALIMSGLSPSPFLFYGFTSNKRSGRRKEYEDLKDCRCTIIFYESPHRLKESLTDMLDVFGHRKIAVVREISKVYEEVYRGKIEDVINQMTNVKGEIVIVLEGNKSIDTYDIEPLEHIKILVSEGLSEKEAIKKVAKMHKINKNDLYKEYHTGKC